MPTKYDIVWSIPDLDIDHQELHLKSLTEFFCLWETPRTYANKLYFIEIKGIQTILNLYSLILQNDWTDAPVELKYTEYLILNALLEFCENLSLLRVFMTHGGLNMVFQSLLRAKIEPGILFTDGTVDGEFPTLDVIVHCSINALCK